MLYQNCPYQQPTVDWLTTIKQLFIRLVLTVCCAITGELVINALTISTFKLRVKIARRIFSWKSKQQKTKFNVISTKLVLKFNCYWTLVFKYNTQINKYSKGFVEASHLPLCFFFSFFPFPESTYTQPACGTWPQDVCCAITVLVEPLVTSGHILVPKGLQSIALLFSFPLARSVYVGCFLVSFVVSLCVSNDIC